MRFRASFIVEAPSTGEAQIEVDRVLMTHARAEVVTYHLEQEEGDGAVMDPIEPALFTNLVDAVLTDCESYSLDDDGDREEVARRLVQALEG